MAKTDSTISFRSEPSGETPCGQNSWAMRVDSAHETPDLASEVPSAFLASRGEEAADDAALEQLRLQATQLASYLRERHKALDHREAELNCRAARSEADARSMRLWMDERREELTAQNDAIAKAQEELSAKERVLEENERELSRCRQELVVREEALTRREEALGAREAELRRCLERLAASEAALEKKSRAFPAENAVAPSRDSGLLEKQKEQLHRLRAALEQKRRLVERRAERVEQSRAVLENLRSEVSNVHREALEIRLATEELWARLAGAAPPAALTRSLGQIRAKLAEQYQQANAELAEQRREIKVLRGQLRPQFEKLTEQKRQIERWAAACQEECRQQADRLAARELEIHRAEARLRREWDRLQSESMRCGHGVNPSGNDVLRGGETAIRAS